MMRDTHTRTTPLPEEMTRYNLHLSKEHNELLLKLRGSLMEQRKRNVPFAEVFRDALECLAKQEKVAS